MAMKTIPDGWRFRSSISGKLILQKRVGYYGSIDDHISSEINQTGKYVDATTKDLHDFIAALGEPT